MSAAFQDVDDTARPWVVGQQPERDGSSAASGGGGRHVLPCVPATSPPPGLTLAFCKPCNRRDAAHRYGICTMAWSH